MKCDICGINYEGNEVLGLCICDLCAIQENYYLIRTHDYAVAVEAMNKVDAVQKWYDFYKFKFQISPGHFTVEKIDKLI